MVLDGECGTLDHPLIHYNYTDVAHFIAKQERYTDIEAGIRFAEGIHPRLRTFLTGPLRQFWWRFVTLRGYVDGLHGLRLSLLMAYYEYQTWVRVARLWRAKKT